MIYETINTNQAKTKLFLVNGNERKRYFAQNGNVYEMARNSRKRGYLLDNDDLAQIKTITPIIKDKFKQEVSNCIALIINPPSSSSRALDKYFENGEYTARLVAEIKKRAAKNTKLKDILTKQWKWEIA